MPVVIASLLLTLLAIAASLLLSLKLTRPLLGAVLRATVQLLAVGYALVFLANRPGSLWPWVWVGAMILIAAIVLTRRSPIAWVQSRLILIVSVLLLSICSAITLLIFFGLGVFDYQPITMLVLVGLTIGNAMPAAVLALQQTHRAALDHSSELEALLALGADRRQAISYLAQQPARLALIPQIERTKVVGLIALPGAMSGLLLAGTDPIEAVVTQLLVMFMVLGAVALAVVSLTFATCLLVITSDLRVAPWLAESH